MSFAPTHACACLNYSHLLGTDDAIGAFYSLRALCPALQATIPDNLVASHRKFLESEPDKANHCSVPYLAFLNGSLSDFTRPLHRFILDGKDIHKTVSTQYAQDLRETWLIESDHVSRFKKARCYLSRLAELHFAEWLEAHQWQVSNMELYGGSFDIDAVSKEQKAASFEIKFLAQREVVFELNCASFQSAIAGSLGVYSPADYLLFRLYEAAYQLHESKSRRIAVAIIRDYELSFGLSLPDGWIDWANPKFLRRDSEIEPFLSTQYSENPNLDNDVKTYITSLNEILILRYQNEFKLELVHHIKIAGAQ